MNSDGGRKCVHSLVLPLRNTARYFFRLTKEKKKNKPTKTTTTTDINEPITIIIISRQRRRIGIYSILYVRGRKKQCYAVATNYYYYKNKLSFYR